MTDRDMVMKTQAMKLSILYRELMAWKVHGRDSEPVSSDEVTDAQEWVEKRTGLDTERAAIVHALEMVGLTVIDDEDDDEATSRTV